MVSRADLKIYQGDDYSAMVTVSDGVTAPDDILVGYTARAQIRECWADEIATAIELQTSIDSPFINLFLPRTETVKMSGEYVWDLEIKSSTDIVTTVLAGEVQVMHEVTR